MYEKYWESDDEHDEAELAETRRDDFVANLKKGGQMPLVLPAKDEKQFRRLLTKKALKHEAEVQFTYDNEPLIKKEELMDMSSEMTDTKARSLSTRLSAATLRKSTGGPGETIGHLMHKDASPLMLFQLPSSLSALSSADSASQVNSSRTKNSTVMSDNKSADTSAILKQQQLTKVKPSAMDAQGKAKHCLSGLPEGVEIGKLQILKSGKAIMNIGGHIMDVSESIPSRYFETAVYIETHSDEIAGPSSSSASAATPIRSTALNNNNNGLFSSKANGLFTPIATTNLAPRDSVAKPTKNTISVLGDISYSFVCSYDLRSMRSQTKAAEANKTNRRANHCEPPS